MTFYAPLLPTHWLTVRKWRKNFEGSKFIVKIWKMPNSRWRINVSRLKRDPEIGAVHSRTLMNMHASKLIGQMENYKRTVMHTRTRHRKWAEKKFDFLKTFREILRKTPKNRVQCCPSYECQMCRKITRHKNLLKFENRNWNTLEYFDNFDESSSTYSSSHPWISCSTRARILAGSIPLTAKLNADVAIKAKKTKSRHLCYRRFSCKNQKYANNTKFYVTTNSWKDNDSNLWANRQTNRKTKSGHTKFKKLLNNHPPRRTVCRKMPWKNATHGNVRPIRTSRTIVNIRMRCARTFTILAILTTSHAIGSPPFVRRLDSRTIHRGEFFFLIPFRRIFARCESSQHRATEFRGCNEKKRKRKWLKNFMNVKIACGRVAKFGTSCVIITKLSKLINEYFFHFCESLVVVFSSIPSCNVQIQLVHRSIIHLFSFSMKVWSEVVDKFRCHREFLNEIDAYCKFLKGVQDMVS